MAYRSPWEHLKPEIEAAFKEGKQPRDLYGKYPDVPKPNIRHWFKQFQGEAAPQAAPQAAPTPETPETPRLSIIEGTESPDFLCPADCDNPRDELKQVKREIWRHAVRPKKDSAIAIQGFNAYLRAMSIEHSLPDVDDLTADEKRIERLAEILQSARDRRDRQSAAG